MLQNKRQNIHHSKLPAPGAIVIVSGLYSNGRNGGYKRGSFGYRRFIVESFNLCDSPDPRYSWGIHLANLRALDNGKTVTVAGHLCEEVEA